MLPYACRNLGHHGGHGGHGHQPRCQDVLVQEDCSNECGIEGNNNGKHNGSGETYLVPDGELHFINNAYEIHEQGDRQYDYDMGFTSNEREYQNDLYFKGETIHGLMMVMTSTKDHKMNPFKVITMKASKKMSLFLP